MQNYNRSTNQADVAPAFQTTMKDRLLAELNRSLTPSVIGGIPLSKVMDSVQQCLNDIAHPAGAEDLKKKLIAAYKEPIRDIPSYLVFDQEIIDTPRGAISKEVIFTGHVFKIVFKVHVEPQVKETPKVSEVKDEALQPKSCSQSSKPLTISDILENPHYRHGHGENITTELMRFIDCYNVHGQPVKRSDQPLIALPETGWTITFALNQQELVFIIS